jgi:hypothetical protein
VTLSWIVWRLLSAAYALVPLAPLIKMVFIVLGSVANANRRLLTWKLGREFCRTLQWRVLLMTRCDCCCGLFTIHSINTDCCRADCFSLHCADQVYQLYHPAIRGRDSATILQRYKCGECDSMQQCVNCSCYVSSQAQFKVQLLIIFSALSSLH